MGFPSTPDKVLIKNQYYPLGLNEENIYLFWLDEKDRILDQTKNREVFFYITPELNSEPVVRRHLSSNVFIKLNSRNYESVINGHTTGVISCFDRIENFGILDIDSLNFGQNKECALDVYEYFSHRFPVRIYFTGKTGFHLRVNFERRYSIDRIREQLHELIAGSDLKKYMRTGVRNNYPQIDLSPNKFRGGFVTLGSLNKIGLQCKEIAPDELRNFRPEDAKIKILFRGSKDVRFNSQTLNREEIVESVLEERMRHRIPSILPKRDRDAPVMMNVVAPLMKIRDWRQYGPGIRPMTFGALHMNRANIRVGSTVLVVEKRHQATGELTRGRVVKILTPSQHHPLGIKVMLDNGKIGRTQKILVY